MHFWNMLVSWFVEELEERWLTHYHDQSIGRRSGIIPREETCSSPWENA